MELLYYSEQFYIFKTLFTWILKAELNCSLITGFEALKEKNVNDIIFILYILTRISFYNCIT